MDVVSHTQWVEARQALLEKEKQFTRLRDELSELRRGLPWEEVTEDYEFQGPDGPVRLSELFDGRSQLIVYHFMYAPGWEAGCKSCSFLADHFDPAVVHLRHRDVSFVAVSKAPMETIAAYRKRMGWSFPWVSSFGNDFNRDCHVSFTEEEIERGDAYYNYRNSGSPSVEAPGASVFHKDPQGTIHHTYSVYARGLDMFITTYHYLDIVPKGRDEGGLPASMAWVRRHDEYGQEEAG